MSEREFLSQIESLYLSIEEWLDNHPVEPDYERQEGILMIDLPQGKQMIISRQLPLKEVWLACPNGAYHFRLNAEQWLTQKGEELFSIMAQEIK